MKNKKIIIAFFQITILLLSSPYFFSQEKIESKEDFNMCKNYYKSGEYDKAIKCFSDVIWKATNTNLITNAHVYLGLTYYTIGDRQQARNHLISAIGLKPDKYLDQVDFSADFINFFRDIKPEFVGIGYIESTPPNAFVYHNNKIIGATPFKKELLPGEFSLTIVKWGYPPIEANINIMNNEITNLSIDFSKQKSWKTFFRSSFVVIALHYILKLL